MAAHDEIFEKLGFTADDVLKEAIKTDADDPTTGEGSLSHNGEYQVLGAWTKSDVQVHLERNTAPEDQGEDMTAVVTHPPVFVVSKAGKRVAAAMQRDPEALEAVLSDLG